MRSLYVLLSAFVATALSLPETAPEAAPELASKPYNGLSREQKRCMPSVCWTEGVSYRVIANAMLRLIGEWMNSVVVQNAKSGV